MNVQKSKSRRSWVLTGKDRKAYQEANRESLVTFFSHRPGFYMLPLR